MKKIQLFGMCLSIFAMSACSVATDTKEVSLMNQEFTYSEIDEGPNTATFDYTSEDVIYSVEGVTAENIYSAKLTSVEIRKNDSLSFSEINGLKLSILSANEDLEMTDLALKSEITENDSVIILDFPTEEVDLAPFLKETSFTMVLDADFKTEDYENEKVLEAGIKIDIEVTK